MTIKFKQSEVYSLYYDALKNKYNVYIKNIYVNNYNVSGSSYYSSDTKFKTAGICIINMFPALIIYKAIMLYRFSVYMFIKNKDFIQIDLIDFNNSIRSFVLKEPSEKENE